MAVGDDALDSYELRPIPTMCRPSSRPSSPAAACMASHRQRSGTARSSGSDPAKHRDSSAVTHVAKGKSIPPFLILHVADHPDTTAQAQRLAAVLKDAGIPTKVFAAKETNHTKLNDNLGLPDDPATKALFEFVAESLKK